MKNSRTKTITLEWIKAVKKDLSAIGAAGGMNHAKDSAEEQFKLKRAFNTLKCLEGQILFDRVGNEDSFTSEETVNRYGDFGISIETIKENLGDTE